MWNSLTSYSLQNLSIVLRIDSITSGKIWRLFTIFVPGNRTRDLDRTHHPIAVLLVEYAHVQNVACGEQWKINDTLKICQEQKDHRLIANVKV